jgi:cobyric acid synthase
MNYLILFNVGTNGIVHLIKNKFKENVFFFLIKKFKENVNMCHNVDKKN